mmetsp:Transcript_155954/g.498375  ORF Transcript_155954/g.498375 Transcript_155954/m.498375 type:complete len:255 (+) Transcript_155954:610-1374(+)
MSAGHSSDRGIGVQHCGLREDLHQGHELLGDVWQGLRRELGRHRLLRLHHRGRLVHGGGELRYDPHAELPRNVCRRSCRCRGIALAVRQRRCADLRGLRAGAAGARCRCRCDTIELWAARWAWRQRQAPWCDAVANAAAARCSRWRRQASARGEECHRPCPSLGLRWRERLRHDTVRRGCDLRVLVVGPGRLGDQRRRQQKGPSVMQAALDQGGQVGGHVLQVLGVRLRSRCHGRYQRLRSGHVLLADGRNAVQ